MRIEAPTLQEAFQKAAEKLKCSVTELDIKVIQHPRSGFLGFFKQNAIIDATLEVLQTQNVEKTEKREKNKQEKNLNEKQERNPEKQHKNEKKREKRRNKKHNEPKSHTDEIKKQNSINDPFVEKDETKATEYIIKKTDEVVIKKIDSKTILDTSIIENFNADTPVKMDEKQKKQEQKVVINFDEILPIIRSDLVKLFKVSSFSINKIEVSKYSDDCVLIEFDGEDAALLIGKEGYRYKAISYLLHNWLNSKYNLSVRLEIAEFLKNQENTMEQYLQGVIERVEQNGKAQTKPLDGVLVKIALAKLREKFPDKYVGIKSNGNEKFVVVNEFFKK
ncbi:Jag N-terminal domain-containing protein [Campylobacter majalis]|uniref:Jag N-terminal domain-containing protein n=1 Tax=Campylobacter majalis TaxID=2790656 RepID=UPI003D6954D3